MTSTDDSPSRRVGDAERQSAIDRLGVHYRAGRLDASEHEARTTKAFHAVTQGDLDSLFVDLPTDTPHDVVAAPAPASAPPAQASMVGSWLSSRRGALLGLVPILATFLFFVTGYHWQWFLLVPLVYGVQGVITGDRKNGSS